MRLACFVRREKLSFPLAHRIATGVRSNPYLHGLTKAPVVIQVRMAVKGCRQVTPGLLVISQTGAGVTRVRQLRLSTRLRPWRKR